MKKTTTFPVFGYTNNACAWVHMYQDKVREFYGMGKHAVLTNALPVEHCRIIIYDTKLYTQTQECDDPSSPLGEIFSV